MFKDKCHLCGTMGKLWTHHPEVFVCPNCNSIFSRFGVVLSPHGEETQEQWN